MDFDQLCNKFLKSSENIRFVGIINPSGNLILQKNRKDTISLLSDDETNMLIHYSFSRWKRLENIEYKLGKIKETVTKFEKVSTIMLFYNENLFLISTDPKSNNSKIISDLWRIIDGKPARTSASKKKKAAVRKPARTSASKKKKAAVRKPARTSASKKKKAAVRKPARTSASKKKKAAVRKPARTSASKKKKAAVRKPARTSASKKKKAAVRKPARTSASKKKKAAVRKPARTSASKKKKAAVSISKNYAHPELKSKLDQLEEYANSLYQKIRK